jgi:NhaP-type Na+/H+ or K+/H+ antiporter
VTDAEIRLVGLGLILVIGIGAQWVAWRVKLPSILLLLICGFIAGPVMRLLQLPTLEKGYIFALDPTFIFGGLLMPIVSLAVAVILFEGGLTLRLAELPRMGAVVWNLITIGALITWGCAALGAHYLLGLTWPMAAMLGAILIVTGPTVVLPLLAHVRPAGRVGAILKWEGIIIDPAGVMVTVLVFEAISHPIGDATSFFVAGVLRTILIGTLCGLLGAGFLVVAMRKYWVPDFLHSPVALAVSILAFTVANSFQHESGLLAAIIMGLVLANQRLVSIRHIVEFKENLRVLLIAVLFILLAARLEWNDLKELSAGSIAFLAVMVLVARPLSVLVSSFQSRLDRNEIIFLCSMAPRGVVAAAVSSIFSLRLVDLGYTEARVLVPVTVVIVVGTVAIYGLSALPLAKRLGLSRSNPQGVLFFGAHEWARRMARALRNNGIEVLLVDTDPAAIAEARREGLPVLHGDIMAEEVSEEVEQGTIGRLLALTSNEDANALACLHFLEKIGRAEVYQLPPKDKGLNKKENVKPPPGRLLFEARLTYSYIADLIRAGATVKAMRLSEEFNFKAYKTRYGGAATPLFLISELGDMQVFTADNAGALAPRAGQTLISLVLPSQPAPGEAEVGESGVAAPEPLSSNAA